MRYVGEMRLRHCAVLISIGLCGDACIPRFGHRRRHRDLCALGPSSLRCACRPGCYRVTAHFANPLVRVSRRGMSAEGDRGSCLCSASARPFVEHSVM